MTSSLKILLLVSISIFCSCGPRIKTIINQKLDPLTYNEEVHIIGLNETLPIGAKVLGKVKIGDTGFSTKCSYDIAIEKAILEAKKIGGNAIKITESKPPAAFGSTCHRISVDILKVDPSKLFKTKNDDYNPRLDYAILNVYRPGNYGSMVGYNLFLGDSLLCRVKSNFKKSIKISKQGLDTIWAKTETKEILPVNLKHGNTYYLRCSIGIGAIVGRPKLEFIESKIAKTELESIKKR